MSKAMPNDAQGEFDRLLAEANDALHRAAANAWLDVPPFIFRRAEFQPLWSAVERVSEVKAAQGARAARQTEVADGENGGI